MKFEDGGGRHAIGNTPFSKSYLVQLIEKQIPDFFDKGFQI